MLHRRIVRVKSLALVALLGLASGSMLEPTVGVLRDGAVHHETAATAAAHGWVASGEHGHEDGARSPSQHQHGSRHQHGTAADHCTHAHGTAVASIVLLSFGAPIALEQHDVTYLLHTTPGAVHSPPPRA
jgi:hypothetical protein